MREMLAVALAKQIGKVLTPELACAIGREAASTPDLSIDPWQFAPEHRDGIVFQCERLMDGGLELRQQRTAYLYETSDGLPIRTNWSSLISMSRAGRHIIFTARDANRVLLASVWLLVGENIDTGRLSVTDDLLYVVPAHRGSTISLRLVQYAEKCCFSMGVREATFHSRLENGAARLARFLGYRPVATRVTKTHDGENYADVPTRHMEVFDGSVT